MSDVELTKRMPLEELQQTKEYLRLTARQKLWVSTYVATGMDHGDYDSVLATRTAYRCRSNETARVLSYAVLNSVRIIEVLNRHFRTEPIDALLKVIDKAIQNKRITGAQIQALRMKIELLQLPSGIPAPANENSMGIQLPAGVESIPQVSSDPKNRKPQTRRRGYPAGKPRKIPKKTTVAEPTQYEF